MRVAVISDIHANLAALRSVVADWGNVDAIWCLGDVVGYGPDPNECLDVVRSLTSIIVAGNHDWAATGKIDTVEFNQTAAIAAEWTSDQLDKESRSFFDGLPTILTVGDYTLVHGSPRDPLWEYIRSAQDAAACFTYFDNIACLVGHTHVPVVFSANQPAPTDRWGVRREPKTPTSVSDFGIGGKKRYLINVGSVGQPRDGDPRACYLILDLASGHFQHRRVAYDIRSTQERMKRVGLPVALWQRLAIGR